MEHIGDTRPFQFSSFLRDRDLLFILIIALITRAAAVLPVHSSGYTSDEREYITMSRTLAGGGEFIDSNGERSTRAPLFPYALSIIVRLFGANLIIQHTVGCLLGALAVLLAYQLSILLWGARQPALVVAGVMAVYPGLVIYSTLLQTETLYIVLALASTLLVYRWIDVGGMMPAILVGITAGLAALTRAVFFGFIPILFLLAFAVKGKKRGRAAEVILAVVACIIIISPWAIRNYGLYETLVPVSSGGGNSLLTGNNPFATGTWRVEEGFDAWYRGRANELGVTDVGRLNEVARSSLSGAIATEFIVDHPWETLGLAIKKAHIFLVYPIAHTDSNIPVQLLAVCADVVLLLGAGLGLVSHPPSRLSLSLIGTAIVFFFLAQVVLHAEARFRLPLVPFLCLFFGWGAGLVADRNQFKEALAMGRARRTIVSFAGGIMLVYGWTAWLFMKGSIR